MARGMHRHRKIRLANLAQTKIATRSAKAPSKAQARSRRAARIVAKIKATPAGTPYSAEVQSWLAATLKKPFSRIGPEEIAAVTG